MEAGAGSPFVSTCLESAAHQHKPAGSADRHSRQAILVPAKRTGQPAAGNLLSLAGPQALIPRKMLLKWVQLRHTRLVSSTGPPYCSRTPNSTRGAAARLCNLWLLIHELRRGHSYEASTFS